MLHRKTTGDVAVRHRRSLRKTISLYDKLTSSLLEFLEELVRECGPTANAELRRCEVLLSTVFQEFPYEQGDHCDHGRSFLMNEREKHLHIAGIGHEHHTSTDGQADILCDRHPEHMKERKRCQKTLCTFGRRKPANELPNVGRQIAVTQLRAFRHAGGAPCVLEDRDIVRGHDRKLLRRDGGHTVQHIVEEQRCIAARNLNRRSTVSMLI